MQLNKSQGVLSSPGFGYGKYPNNLQCTWNINEPNGTAVDMIFHFFETEKDYDFVTVTNGTKPVMIARYSGSLATSPSQSWILLTRMGQLTVLFTSDASYTRRGFNVTFSIGSYKYTCIHLCFYMQIYILAFYIFIN